jgi:hypothetical protein
MKSLFVVSLPRSLSTTLYHAASRSLQLHEPAWTTGGEILNRDRVRVRKRKSKLSRDRYTLRESEPDLFERTGTALAGSAEKQGFAYKDVVQPFVVAERLALGEFCVLKVERDVAEVAYAMIHRHWQYPGSAASLHGSHPWSLIEGLLRAERALAALPGETVHYADALSSHNPLSDALQRLYPESHLAPIGYIDRRFLRTRRRLQEKRRESRLFRELEHGVAAVRETLESERGDHPLEYPRREPSAWFSVATSR